MFCGVLYNQYPWGSCRTLRGASSAGYREWSYSKAFGGAALYVEPEETVTLILNWSGFPPENSAGGHRSRGDGDRYLVFRHRWIDFIAPRQNPASHVAHMREAVLFQKIDCLLAAHAASAMHDNIGIRIKFVQPLG